MKETIGVTWGAKGFEREQFIELERLPNETDNEIILRAVLQFQVQRHTNPSAARICRGADSYRVSFEATPSPVQKPTQIIMAMKRPYRPVVGDERWEVEWCVFSFVDENGDGDPDRDRYTSRLVKTWAEAQKEARRVFPTCCYGSVRITPMRFEPYDEDDAARYPHVGFWEAVGDSVFFEGE